MKLIVWLSLFVHLSSFVFAQNLGGTVNIECSDWVYKSDCDRTYPTLPLQSYDWEQDAQLATHCCSKYCYYLNGKAC